MPPPVSYIDISSDPFSRTVTQAEFNVANEIWFKYSSVSPIVGGVQTNSGGTFTPRTTIYGSDGTTIVKNAFTGIFGAWQQLGISDYYIKVVRSAGGASNFDFTFTFETALLDVVSLAAGDSIINDDLNEAALLVDISWNVKTFLSGIPGGEMGAVIPSNLTFWHDFYAKYSSTNRIAIFDATLNYITSVACGLTSTNKPKFAVDVTNDQVYVINQANGLWVIDNTGIATNTGYSFPAIPQAACVNEDGTLLYWVTLSDFGTIHVVDLGSFTDITDLYTVPGWTAGVDKFAQTANNHPGDMFVMPDGNIVAWWYETGTLEYHLIVVDSGGSLVYSYDYADPIQIDHLAYIEGDSAHIIIWLYTTEFLDTGHFGRLTLATGVIDLDAVKELGSGGINEVGTDKFPISTSCTLIRMQSGAIPPPGDTGSIIVNKVTAPAGITQQFDFTSPGLTPSSFSLTGDGDSRTFVSVPVTSPSGGCWATGALATGSWAVGAWAGAGGTPGYGISETPVAGYTTTYNVSNGSAHTNVTVDTDEVVVITVTNSKISTAGSGIYKIDPMTPKRNDTVWDADGGGTTTRKIPDPFAITGFIGD